MTKKWPPTPRKTLAETKAEYFMRGFSRCMEIMRKEWRSRVSLRDPDPNHVVAPLWPILEKMDVRMGLYDDDYKEIAWPRLYPDSDWKRLRVRVKLISPHPHAGKEGFILDSSAFATEDGMWMVYFEDYPENGASCALAKPTHWRRIRKK